MLQNHLRCAIITVAHLLFWGDFVKKAKKYIYPIVFSMFFVALYEMLVRSSYMFSGRVNNILSACAMLFLMAWIFVVLPFYCVKYSKIIIGEKLKFLFSIYNCIVLGAIPILPFSLQNDGKVVVVFFIWVAIWTFVPLVIRLNFTKKHDDNNSNETGDSVTKV